ncbi:MAG: UDP-N-acetylmuramyl-tripeptide synthetase [Microbacteriaceae bacterium]
MSKSLDFRPIGVPEIRLSQLAEALGGTVHNTDSDPQIRGISLDSKQLRPGDVFAALAGKFQHGAKYAEQALSAEAVAILTDAEGLGHILDQGLALPVLVVERPRLAAATAAELLYTRGKTLPQLFGVTGTNGKTMTMYLLDEIARLCGQKTALSTTAERRIGDINLVGGLTTPESTELHALIGVMAEQNVDTALIEVSAQAVTHNRLLGQHFSVMSFLNLSHDHLDDYASMEEYYRAKARLFHSDISAAAVISLDTEWGERLYAETHIPKLSIDWSDSPRNPDWTVEIVSQDLELSELLLSNAKTGEQLNARVELFGEQVLFDTAIAILMFLSAGVNFDRLKSVLGEHSIPWTSPGRMEILRTPHAGGVAGPTMILDYGHTPEAFTHSLKAINSVHSGPVIMLFGVDGDRDTTKRAAMAENAAAQSDIVIITDYNPRFEDPGAIRGVLLEAIKSTYPERELHEEADPASAIRLAIRLAGDNGLIFWAGPGHEDYREVQGQRLDYSSREDSLAALAEAGWLP